MIGIDLTAHLVPAGIGLVALLAMAVVGIGSCIDDGKRAEMQSWARRVGAWWVGRAEGGTPPPAMRLTRAGAAPRVYTAQQAKPR